MKFKVGDRVRIVVNGDSSDYKWADGLGTIVKWEGKLITDGGYFVRLDHKLGIYATETDNHHIPKKYIRTLTKLEKALL